MNIERWNFSMELNEILSKVDHTLLAQTATWAEIKAICDDGMKYHTASVCIPASYVKQAKDYVGDKLPICTVIGFPNGYDTTKAKCLEALDAVQNGADEIDYVVNLTRLKEKDYTFIEKEMEGIVETCRARGAISKVIFENCYLTQEEKIALCDIARSIRPDFVKTSTGFGTGGATEEDVRLMVERTRGEVKVKAAGGIRTLDAALRMIDLGVSRIGSTASVKIMEEFLAR